MAVGHDYYQKAPMYLPTNYLSKITFIDDISVVIVISDEIMI